ncbi:F-box/kelch-repeat protein [Trifolium repens]|nr:F-box/kelch-repeat protein [Trifolium repens]
MSESHDDQNLCIMNDEISVVNDMLSVVTLTSPDDSHFPPALPTLSLDLVEEILCRLSVKLLCQLRCVCKSWNSLISDPKFAKKHLCHSTTRRIHFLSCSTRRIRSCISHPPNNLLTSYPLDSLFTNEVTTNVSQLEYPHNNYDNLNYILRGSCNGILCLADYDDDVILLCNPSLRKFKKLPPFQMLQQVISHVQKSYGFGYDLVNDNYKVVAVLNYYIGVTLEIKTDVKVYTFSTNCWKNIGEFPFDGIPVELSGKFVSGTIYWLACKEQWLRKSPCFIVSFDLENESFQEVPKPDYGIVDENFVNLSVLKDCLCLICGYDIWLMKECRNKESWIKLFTVSYMRDPSKSYALNKAIYIFEDGQVLLESHGDWGLKLIVYHPKINTFKFTKFQNKSVYNSRYHEPEVSIESLILP